jgi:hypothetical protein
MDNKDFITTVMSKVSENFMDEKSVEPMVIIVDGERAMAIPVGVLISNQEKELVANIIAGARGVASLVIFVTEAWMVKIKGKKNTLTGSLENHPDRSEKAFLITYEKENVNAWSADIMRSGDWAELGKWEQFDAEIEGVLVPAPKNPPEWN